MIKTKSREERRQIVLSLQDELKVELISSYDDYEDTMDENREHKSEQLRKKKEKSRFNPFKSTGFSPYCLDGYEHALN